MKISVCGFLFLILFTLKMLGLTTVSWWLVVLPLLVPFILLIVIYGGMMLFAIVAYLIDYVVNKKK